MTPQVLGQLCAASLIHVFGPEGYVVRVEPVRFTACEGWYGLSLSALQLEQLSVCSLICYVIVEGAPPFNLSRLFPEG